MAQKERRIMSLVERDTCLRCNVLLEEIRIKNNIIGILQEELLIKDDIVKELTDPKPKKKKGFYSFGGV